MNRALASLALAGLAAFPLALRAQDLPEALKDKALVVRITAIVPAAAMGDQGGSPSQPGSSGQSGAAAQANDKPRGWEAQSVKYTVPGTPVPFKLVGSNVAVIVQLTPFEQDDAKGVTLIAQGQVWVKPPEGGLSYHTTLDTLSVGYGETVLFYPLGLSPEGKAPLTLEISVTRLQDSGQDAGASGDKAGK